MFCRASVSLLPVACCLVFLSSNRSHAGPCQLDKLTAEDGFAFGASVAISDPWVVVGDPGDSSPCTSSGCGTITVFRREDQKWIRGPKLTGSHVGFSDVFGASVEIDGNVIVVGAPHSDPTGSDIGEAYVFRYNGSAWMQEARLIPSGSALDDKFGQSVAVSGNVVAVGAPRLNSFTGRVYVFRWNGTAWVEEASFGGGDTGVGDAFGGAVALEGEVLVVGARGDDDACPSDPKCESGAAYVFGFDGADWVQEDKLTAGDKAAGDLLGWSVDLSGVTAVVGALDAASGGVRSGAAYLFEAVGSTWAQRAKLTAVDSQSVDAFGRAVAIHGTTVLVGARPARAYVFTRAGEGWLQADILTAPQGTVGAFGAALDLQPPYTVVGGSSETFTYFAPECIPTVSHWGLAALAVLILIAATLSLRRQAARLALVWVLLPWANAAGQSPNLTHPHHPERFLVRFRESVSDETRTDIHATIGAERLRDYAHPRGLTLVRVTPDPLVTALGDYLNRAENLYAEPDYKRFPAAECLPDDYDPTPPVELWGLDRIKAPEAWCIDVGEADLRVAVIDGGVWFDPATGQPHVDLADNLWTNPGEIPGNGIDEDGNGYVDDVHGYDFRFYDGHPEDDLDSHGTHVSGTVGAVGNNGSNRSRSGGVEVGDRLIVEGGADGIAEVLEY